MSSGRFVRRGLSQGYIAYTCTSTSIRGFLKEAQNPCHWVRNTAELSNQHRSVTLEISWVYPFLGKEVAPCLQFYYRPSVTSYVRWALPPTGVTPSGVHGRHHSPKSVVQTTGSCIPRGSASTSNILSLSTKSRTHTLPISSLSPRVFPTLSLRNLCPARNRVLRTSVNNPTSTTPDKSSVERRGHGT